MKIYDKAQWQIEGGISENQVIRHFEFIFNWLNKQGFLSGEGKEIIDTGIDDSVVLTDNMLTNSGKQYLDNYYDEYLREIKYGSQEDEEWLDKHL